MRETPVDPRAPVGEATVLPLRAHPRVLLTLRVIASTPGLSSRQVSERVNSRQARHDISGLFTLLEQRGLIENTRAGRGARDRTAWRRPYMAVVRSSFSPTPRTARVATSSATATAGPCHANCPHARPRPAPAPSRSAA